MPDIAYDQSVWAAAVVIVGVTHIYAGIITPTFLGIPMIAIGIGLVLFGLAVIVGDRS